MFERPETSPPECETRNSWEVSIKIKADKEKTNLNFGKNPWVEK